MYKFIVDEAKLTSSTPVLKHISKSKGKKGDKLLNVPLDGVDFDVTPTVEKSYTELSSSSTRHSQSTASMKGNAKYVLVKSSSYRKYLFINLIENLHLILVRYL